MRRVSLISNLVTKEEMRRKYGMEPYKIEPKRTKTCSNCGNLNEWDKTNCPKCGVALDRGGY